jgi:hypothetical protein
MTPRKYTGPENRDSMSQLTGLRDSMGRDPVEHKRYLVNHDRMTWRSSKNVQFSEAGEVESADIPKGYRHRKGKRIRSQCHVGRWPSYWVNHDKRTKRRATLWNDSNERIGWKDGELPWWDKEPPADYQSLSLGNISRQKPTIEQMDRELEEFRADRKAYASKMQAEYYRTH